MAPSTKNAVSIGQTTMAVIKDTTAGISDKINFNVYDGSSPNNVMNLNGETGASNPVATGTVCVHDLNVSGTLTTSTSTSAPTITIGEKLLFTDKDPDASDTTTVIGSIYASTGSTANDHILYIDPYQEDVTSDGTPNKGTVHILGSLIVEGDKTILDTATKVTSDNAIAVNGTVDTSGNLVGATATSGGLTFAYSSDGTLGTTTQKNLFYDTVNSYWTIGLENFHTTGTVNAGPITATGQISTTLDTDSTSITTGALTVAGGVGISKALYVGGVLSASSSVTASGKISTTLDTQSTSTITGALTVAGGVGISKALNVNNVNIRGTSDSTSITTGALVVAGGVGISKALYVGGALSASSSVTTSGQISTTLDTQSTSTITGALTVAGGVGISKALNVGGALSASSVTTSGQISTTLDTDSTSITTGALTVAGGVGISKALNVNNVNIRGTSDSNSSDTGALVVEGGVAIKKHLYLGQGTTGVLGYSIRVASVSAGDKSDRISFPSQGADSPVSDIPIGQDIIDDCDTSTFVSGYAAVGLFSTDHAASAIITFLYSNGNLHVQQAFEQSNDYDNLEISIDQGTSITATVTNTTGYEAYYQVRILRLISEDSVNNEY